MTLAAHSVGLTDQPVQSLAEDALGIGPYAASLSRFLAQCTTPMTVAIQGDWGTGKTSLMRMIEADLTDQYEHVGTLCFNTWQYSQLAQTDSLGLSVLSAIYQTLCKDDGHWRQWMEDVSLALIKVYTGADLDKLKGAPQLDMAAKSEKLRKQVGETIASYLKRHEKKRLILFIDDLDRLNPERAVEILEVIKNFLDWTDCVFVLALDFGVVQRGLRSKDRSLEDDAIGRSFFDKIIQLPFRMPVLQYDVLRYLRQVLNASGLHVAPADLETATALLRHSVSTNPRSIKRVANATSLLSDHAKRTMTGGELPNQMAYVNLVLLALTCCETRHESLYRHVMAWSNNLVHLGTVLSILEDPTAAGGTDAQADAAALLSAPVAQSPDFHAFVRAFRRALAIPDRPGPVLETLSTLLNLSSVTSVAPVPATAPDLVWSRQTLLGIGRTLAAQLTDGQRATGRPVGFNTSLRTTEHAVAIVSDLFSLTGRSARLRVQLRPVGMEVTLIPFTPLDRQALAEAVERYRSDLGTTPAALPVSTAADAPAVAFEDPIPLFHLQVERTADHSALRDQTLGDGASRILRFLNSVALDQKI